jgi:hypothetical protein
VRAGWCDVFRLFRSWRNWQTRRVDVHMLEVHVPVRLWRLKSSLPHQSTESLDWSRTATLLGNAAGDREGRAALLKNLLGLVAPTSGFVRCRGGLYNRYLHFRVTSGLSHPPTTANEACV